jgi:uncharacterized protein YjgD (DUF1641 family)
MAAPVEFRKFTPQDSRGDLMRRVENAPVEHAEAVLAAYDLLEQLHEKDLLNLLTGMVAAKNTVVNHVVDVVSSPEAVKGLRLLLMLVNSLKTIDADRLHQVLNEDQAPSLLAIGRQMTSQDARRALGVAAGVLNVFGAALAKKPQAQS